MAHTIQKLQKKIPQHIAIIMDGNGRWAKTRGFPRSIGHKVGADRVREIVREAHKIGIRALSIFAFSTENWNRPAGEIKILFEYFMHFLRTYKNELMRDNIRLRVVGRRDRISARVLKAIHTIEEATKCNTGFDFIICVDYGGRWDITQATKRIAADCRDGVITTDVINEQLLSRYTALAGIPEPDLLIRTSGEQRISNFLLWDIAYSELYFSNICWPDFAAKHLEEAVRTFGERERRYGAA